MKMGNCLHYVDLLMSAYLKEGMVCIDATCGNGNDSLKIASVIGDSGHLYSFDIQKPAVDITKDLLKKAGLNHVTVICDSHDSFETYIDKKVDFIIYNLGYLPGGDKTITTESKSTIKSIETGLKLLKSGALMIVIVYTGHASGHDEGSKLSDFVHTLNQKTVDVSKIHFVNQKNTPPHAYIFNKR